ncbi:enoyl-CoA hydratase [Rhodoplanes elegans]|uniref:Enoyl-CoA hydratase n=1 Tax=Rhodoplanes elegans TaxID=29408 RepID=A0A327KLL8_9BRAD|nr:enoyl-CoA hydratase/isomerase family protein [Rhodoplanes elegans]MBK5958358.1 enoyl-CoA hydratase [Rhodoplanes elegans]RAI39397.1 enoyl-CoA hydratase [Rhodoplanes elegans]
MTDTPAHQLVDLAVDDGVATVTLCRPEVRNAINDAMRAELIAALDSVAEDAAVGAVVITGNGGAFCAGGDVSGMRTRLAEPAGEIAFNGWRRQRKTHRSIASLHQMGKPTIAAVAGPAVGLGCDLALCCDFIVAADSAVFAMSFIHRGLVPDGGGLYFLPRRVGLPRAKELIFSGRRVKAEEALRIGLADRLVGDAELLATAQNWAAELGAGSPVALALTKSILDRTFELPEEQVFALGRQAQAICYTTTAHRESVEAFLSKADRKDTDRKRTDRQEPTR